MPVRRPCASNFYISDCTEKQIKKYLEGFDVQESIMKIVAGIVPHAGWMFSGAVAAKVFWSIKEKNNPSTFILFGANHSWGVDSNSVYPEGAWETPFGPVEVDDTTAGKLLKKMGELLEENPAAHESEHSLEVQLPFIKYFFPDAKIVPITVMPNRQSDVVGKRVAEILLESNGDFVVIGSTDLTHYGSNYGFAPRGLGPDALKWFKENDARIIDLAVRMKGEEIVAEARGSQNACGSGAMAATVSAAKALGAEKGHLLEYTTSYDVYKEREFHMGVGYAGIIF